MYTYAKWLVWYIIIPKTQKYDEILRNMILILYKDLI